MSEVVDIGWIFQAKNIRNNISAGNYAPFIKYVQNLLLETESVQFLADGQEHLPELDNKALYLLYLVLRESLPHIAVVELSTPPSYLFIANNNASLLQRMQNEIDLLYQDGHISELVTLNYVQKPANDS